MSETELLEQMQEITSQISNARFDIKNGNMIDLVGVQNMVKDLCLTIQEYKGPEGDNLNNALHLLIEDFNILGQELSKHRQRLGSEIIKKYSSGPKGDA